MNGCRGGSGTATGCCAAGWPENTGSEPAPAPPGSAAAAPRPRGRRGGGKQAAARTAAFTAAKDRAKAGAQAPVTARRAGSPSRAALRVRSPLAGRHGEPARRAVTGALPRPPSRGSFSGRESRPPRRRLAVSSSSPPPRPRFAAADPPKALTPARCRCSPATPTAQHPVAVPDPPRHPFMAPNGALRTCSINSYHSDVHQRPGPLGQGDGAAVDVPGGG